MVPEVLLGVFVSEAVTQALQTTLMIGNKAITEYNNQEFTRELTKGGFESNVKTNKKHLLRWKENYLTIFMVSTMVSSRWTVRQDYNVDVKYQRTQ